MAYISITGVNGRQLTRNADQTITKHQTGFKGPELSRFLINLLLESPLLIHLGRESALLTARETAFKRVKFPREENLFGQNVLSLKGLEMVQGQRSDGGVVGV